jgi:hypothetical protein
MYLQGGVEDDQFGAGWNGVVAAVVPHELGVDVGIWGRGWGCREEQGWSTLPQVHQCPDTGLL